MKTKRNHCENCRYFRHPKFDKNINEVRKAKCKLGKRVMFRKAILPGINDNPGFIRYCSDFKEQDLKRGCLIGSKNYFNMTDKEQKAINQMSKALKGLHKVGIEICGMDCDLIYATKKALKAAPQRNRGDDYCDPARANQNDNSGETGKFNALCYIDSGGW